ncbi:MAG: transporter [Ruminococcaceae bacterium]|nr:transporter [Oscillospiraceae bacterium]
MTLKQGKTRRITPLQILLLQAVVLVYTTSGIFAKLASERGFLSIGFILLYGAEIAVLGIYAVLWQQMIKRVDLSFAYANRAVAIAWSMLWAAVIFGETITAQNLIGVGIVLIGTMLVNTDHA